MKALNFAALSLSSILLAACVTTGDDPAPTMAAPVVIVPTPVKVPKVEKAKPVVASHVKKRKRDDYFPHSADPQFEAKLKPFAPVPAEVFEQASPPVPAVEPEPTPEPTPVARLPPADDRPATFKERWYHFLRSHGM